MPDESSSLISNPTTKLHYLALFSVSLAKLGDSVEFILPSVITQPVSCELGLSKVQEQILALVLYVSAAVFSIITIPFLRRLPRKPIILFSLYLSIIAGVLCAVMPDYSSLIASRVALGMTVAVSATPLSVYLSEVSPSKEFYVVATVIGSIGWASGGGWCGVLAYLFLERVGWRWFVLLTSIPLFIPPILMFHFVLPETKTYTQNDEVGVNKTEVVTTTKAAMIKRIIKMSVLNILRILPYSGGILLLPSILKEDNIRNNRNSPCQAIHGWQFLTVSLLFGVCHFVGKIIGYALNKVGVSGGTSFKVLSTFNLAAMIVVQFNNTHLVNLLVCLCVVQISLAGMSTEVDLQLYDSFFFTSAWLPVSSALRISVHYIFTIVANVLSELLPYTLVLNVHLGSSIILVLISFLFNLI